MYGKNMLTGRNAELEQRIATWAGVESPSVVGLSKAFISQPMAWTIFTPENQYHYRVAKFLWAENWQRHF